MDCREAQDRLWPADVLRSSDTEVEAALEHAETCAVCRVRLEEAQRMAELIRAAVPRVRAPQQLKERLRAVLAHEPAPPEEDSGRTADPETEVVAVRSRRRIGGIAMVSVGMLIVGFVGYRLANRASDAYATAFAEDYLRRLASHEENWSGDRVEIASLFERELGVAAPPPQIPDFEVERATICLLNGHRGGVVEYRSRSRRLTYYVIPGVPEARVGTPVKDGVVPPVPAIAEEHGLGVAVWSDSRHQHALVGEFSSHDLHLLSALFLNDPEGP